VGIVARDVCVDLNPSEFGAESLGALEALVGMYGALHDIGEIFGGDIIAHVPSEFSQPLKDYQHRCRDRICHQLGIPLPSDGIKKILVLADWLVLYAELHGMRCPHAYRASDWNPVALERSRALGLDHDLKALEEISMRALRELCASDTAGIPRTSRATSVWRNLARPKLCVMSLAETGGHLRFVRGALLSDLGEVREDMDVLRDWARSRVPSDGDFAWHDLSDLRRRGVAAFFPLELQGVA
jgi:hypothetical protein